MHRTIIVLITSLALTTAGCARMTMTPGGRAAFTIVGAAVAIAGASMMVGANEDEPDSLAGAYVQQGAMMSGLLVGSLGLALMGVAIKANDPLPKSEVDAARQAAADKAAAEAEAAAARARAPYSLDAATVAPVPVDELPPLPSLATDELTARLAAQVRSMVARGECPIAAVTLTRIRARHPAYYDALVATGVAQRCEAP